MQAALLAWREQTDSYLSQGVSAWFRIWTRIKYIFIYSILLHEQDATQGQPILSGSLLSWIQNFPSRFPRLKSPTCPTVYLSLAGERTVRFTPFLRVFALCKMQTVSSRTWTPINKFISYDGNHYATNAVCVGASVIFGLCPETMNLEYS